MQLTTIRDLIIHIEPLLGSEADPAIVAILAECLWGDYRVGDEIAIPDDLAGLYLECERVHGGEG